MRLILEIFQYIMIPEMNSTPQGLTVLVPLMGLILCVFEVELLRYFLTSIFPQAAKYAKSLPFCPGLKVSLR